MNILILQIDIGIGTQWNSEVAIDPIRKLFIPSVKEYAKKFNYDYQLITNSQYEKNGGDFLFLASKEKHYSFERYFHFDQNYDFIVYIDNDVYVTKNAQPLPAIKGLMNVAEPEGRSSDIFRQTHSIPASSKYFNSGVTFVDSRVAKHLQNYMQDRMHNKKRALGKNSDNMMLNEYILEFPSNFSELGLEWNYMPFLPNAVSLSQANFFHFVGIHGKKLLKDFIDKNLSPDNVVEDHLKNNL